MKIILSHIYHEFCISAGTTVLIASYEMFEFAVAMEKEHKSKILDLSKLKALILDDGKAILSYMTEDVADTFQVLCHYGELFCVFL